MEGLEAATQAARNPTGSNIQVAYSLQGAPDAARELRAILYGSRSDLHGGPIVN